MLNTNKNSFNAYYANNKQPFHRKPLYFVNENVGVARRIFNRTERLKYSTNRS